MEHAAGEKFPTNARQAPGSPLLCCLLFGQIWQSYKPSAGLHSQDPGSLHTTQNLRLASFHTRLALYLNLQEGVYSIPD